MLSKNEFQQKLTDYSHLCYDCIRIGGEDISDKRDKMFIDLYAAYIEALNKIGELQ